MYQEKHFLNCRSLEAYARKQAGSCLYLIKRYEEAAMDTSDGAWRLVLTHLVGVHRRQYEELGRECECPGGSFYYDSMVRREVPMAPLMVVMYMRGCLRYEALTGWGRDVGLPVVWQHLAWDSLNNRDLCVASIKTRASRVVADEAIQKAVRAEAEVMAQIDERNGLK